MELVDVRALGARAERRGGSTPPESNKNPLLTHKAELTINLMLS